MSCSSCGKKRGATVKTPKTYTKTTIKVKSSGNIRKSK